MRKNEVELFNKVLDLVDIEGKTWDDSCIEVGVTAFDVEAFQTRLKAWMKGEGLK